MHTATGMIVDSINLTGQPDCVSVPASALSVPSNSTPRYVFDFVLAFD